MGRRTLLLAVVAFTAVACGSTAQVDGGVPGTVAPGAAGDAGQVLAGDDSGLSLDPGSTPSSTQGPTFDGTGTSSTGSSGVSAGGAGSTGASSAGPTSSSGSGSGGTTTTNTSQGQPAANGRTGIGVTDDELVVGIAIRDDSAPGNEELLGVSGVTTGDEERYYEIMRDHLNERGGIAGRDIRYSVYRFTTAEGAQLSQLEQAACAHWTQDDPAYTVAFTTSANFLGCAEDAGQVSYSSTLSASDERIFREFPHHVESSAMNLTRQQPNLVAALEAQDYFDDGYKMGVVMWDEPRFVRAFEESLVPALAAAGREVEDQARIKRLESNSDLGQASAEVQSAVLRFKAQGITHVNIVEDNALLAILFMTAAENQNYRPRYGVTSQNGGTTLAGIVPEGQLNGAVGIGWIPTFDVPSSERPQSQAAKDCLALYAASGEEPADDNNAAVMLGVCERMFLTKVAVEAGLPDITNDSFMRGLESLGTSFPSFGSFGNAFGPGRHDGAYLYRHVAYDPACVCFHYVSDPISDLR